jgi:hypothetical protein
MNNEYIVKDSQVNYLIGKFTEIQALLTMINDSLNLIAKNEFNKDISLLSLFSDLLQLTQYNTYCINDCVEFLENEYI